MNLHSRVPDPQVLIDLEPEELAGVLIEYLAERRQENSMHQVNRSHLDLESTFAGYHRDWHDRLSGALVEAWMWLEREGLIVPTRGSGTNGWVRLSRRGATVASAADLAAYRRANLLPKNLLHPAFAQKVAAQFLRGEYDVAIMQAFREVEIAVRSAAGYDAEVLGVDMMRLAFAPKKGPLADRASHAGEQTARMELFAGAIGCYKNPHSHRHVKVEAEEAIELLLFASHLLRLVDEAVERIRPSK